MAAYGKTQPPQMHGFEASRPFPESTFTYTAPSFVPQNGLPPTSSPYQNAGQMTHMTYGSNQTRSTYDDQSGPYLNVGSTPVPQVTSFTPNKGTKDQKIYVYISSLYELVTANVPIFSLMFGSRKCEATLTKLNQQGGVCQYAISADAPMFSTTGWSAPQVPMSMLMESGEGELMGKVDVGTYTYLDSGMTTPNGLDMPRKRKISTDSTELMKSPAKRSNNQLRPKDEYGNFQYTPTEGAPYSPYLQPGTSYGLMGQYGRSPAGYQSQASPRQVPYQYSSSATASPPTIKASSPHVSNWSPAYSTMSSHIRSPGLAHSGRPSHSQLPSPSAANPPLIRTSTLQQTPSPAITPSGHGGQSFNPYALYPHKAVLKIQGDLDRMAEDWSMEEWDAKRRIVHFKRSQSGSTITTTFAPVAVDERPHNSVCISCIWWEEKKECFVTSVDTIYLLEQLVAARFTVEEKNRIRRNLEGFRPLTVSKAKPDSEEFFKVIMAFPNPKPRNIEKDVKVFPWKILSMALKKIIGKYSASPSSTLPPTLLTPVSSTGYADCSSGGYHTGGEHGAISPRSLSDSTSSNHNYSASNLSPNNHLKQLPQGVPSDLRVSVPSYGAPMGDNSSHWSAQPHHMPQSQSSYPGNRNSWDNMSQSYLDSHPSSAAPGTSQQYYPRAVPESSRAILHHGQQIARP